MTPMKKGANRSRAVRTTLSSDCVAALAAARFGRAFESTPGGKGEPVLNTAFLGDPRATILHRVGRDRFKVPPVSEGDILVADRRLKPEDGDLVIALVDGERVVRLFSESKGRRYLRTGAEPRASTELTDDSRAAVVAVVVSLIPVIPAS